MAKILKLAALVGLGYAGYNALSPTDKTAATKALGFKSVPTNETDFIELIKQTIKGDKQLQRLLTGPTGAIGPTGATGATGSAANLQNHILLNGEIRVGQDANNDSLVNLRGRNKNFMLYNLNDQFRLYSINTDNTQSLLLMTVAADGTVSKLGGGSFSVLSDERLKENVLSFTSGLEKVLAIETKTFNYKKVEGTQTEFYPDFLIEKKQYGVIAQQLQAICPEMVTEGEDGFLTVDLSNLSLLLVNAVKELNKKDTDQQKLITSQAAKIKALEDQQALILERLTALEAK